MVANLFKLLFILFFLSSCAVKTVKKNETAQPPATSTGSSAATNNPEEIKDSTLDPQTNTQVINENQPVVTRPKAPTRVALILTGGGAKTWAHIGVLKEIEKAKWPLHAIAGVEWGAVVAASFANQLSANEVEWKLSKIKNLNKAEEAAEVIFENASVADLKIPFVCPSLNIMQQQVYLLNRGQLQSLIPFCLAHYPLMTAHKQSIAMMSDLRSLVQHLKSTGAKKVVMINVLAQSNKKPFTADALSPANALWAQASAQASKRLSGADDVIEISLDNYGIDDLDQRREIIAIGSEMSYDQINKLSQKYGL